MKLFYVSFITLLLLSGVIFVSTSVQAQSILEGVTSTGDEAFERDSVRLPGLSDEEYTPTTPRSPITVAAMLVNIALGLVGIILVLIIIITGYQYMFSSGPETSKKAQKSLVNAGIGLVILLAAYSISYFVLKQLEFAVTGPRTIQIGGTQGETIELPEEINLQGGL